MKTVIVLGGGMVGVSTALHLRRRNWDVVLVDRRAPGLETSYGNAGIIQSEAVEPFAMPRDLRSLFDIATGRTNDVHFHWGSLPQHVGPLLRYWWNSEGGRHRRIAAGWAALIAQATASHQGFIGEVGAEADALVRRQGYRTFYRNPAAFADAVATAERLRAEYGVTFAAMTPAQLASAEPALRQTGAGAIHWLAPWSVRDPGALVSAYAKLFSPNGGACRVGSAETLARTAQGWRVETADGPLEAEHVVLALGPWSPALLARYGLTFPMVRKRGYHRHYEGAALDLPLMDTDNGYVMAPMAKGLRITTGAELTAPDAPLTPVQLGRAETAARGLMDFGQGVEDEPWTGVRPCMPDMLPVIGAAPGQKGLWLNFGHGHQGFTLGPVSGQLLAQMMSGEATCADPSPFSPSRWTGARAAA